MRDPKHIDESQIHTNRQESIDEILELISKVWHENPDLRLCQLISNCFAESDLYYIEDDKLQSRLKRDYKL